MSSSIIEAKFQALDRTIRLLNKTSLRAKVSSSDQLRELVNSQRSQSTPRRDDCKPRLRTEDRPRTARPASRHTPYSDREPAVLDVTLAREWPAWRQRAVPGNPLTLQNAWNATESTARGQGKSATPPERSPRESTTTIAAQQRPLSSNLARARSITAPHAPDNQKEDSRVRLTRTRPSSCAPRKSLLQTLPPSVSDVVARPPRRNWFAPPPQRPASSKKNPTGRRIVPHDTSVDNRSSEAVGSVAEGIPAELSLSPTTEPDPHPDVINDAAFYYLEVRLDHPTPLLDWRFRVLFTDLTLPSRPSVTVNNVPVDEQNVLLFTGPAQSTQRTPTLIRFFDPVRHFPHVKQPRDLYGHCVRILVHSTIPVQRVVIDTIVHFLVEAASSSVPANPPPPTVSQQPDPIVPHEPEKIELVFPRPEPLPSDDECSGWEVDDEMPQDDAYLSPRRLAGSPRFETPCSTTDKKKAELKQIRAAMRRKMREQRQQLRRDHPLPTPSTRRS